jgi:hypothetical protein
MKTTITKALLNSHPYLKYRKLVSNLLLENKSTGYAQSDYLTHYSSINETQMNLLDKTIIITDKNKEKLRSLKEEYIWLVIAEGWCGDAAQLLPILEKMTFESDKIELRIVLRDENDDLMNLFLTNKSKSIPKLIVINKSTGNVLGKWGPRPKTANELIENYKKEFGVVDDTIKTNLKMWYLHDKGASVQNEIVDLMFGESQ